MTAPAPILDFLAADDALLAQLYEASTQGVVLTPNERLARTTLAAFNRLALTHHKSAWRTPRVMSWNRWVVRCVEGLNDVDPDSARLPDAQQTALGLLQTAPAGGGGMLRSAIQAIELLDAYNIPFNALGRTETGRIFQAWLSRFEPFMQSLGLSTASALLLKALSIPADNPALRDVVSITFFEFDLTTPLQRHTMEILERSGITVKQQNAQSRTARTSRIECQTAETELASAARWARAILERHPEARIGVLLPDLNQRRAAVTRQFHTMFHPSGRGNPPVNISGGTPLNEQAVWQIAREFLLWVFDRLPMGRFRRLGSSEYLTVPLRITEGKAQRSVFSALKMRNTYTATSETETLFRMASAHAGAATLAEHLQHWLSLLEAAGWTAGTTGSVQYQARGQVLELLKAYAALPATTRISALQALSQLDALLSQSAFAPESPPAPVQILGTLETAGMWFSHLWVSGLSETSFPSRPTPNALIPLTAMREASVPRVDSADEGRLANRLLTHWMGAADNLIVSHYTQDGDASLNCSPLIADFPVVSLRELHPDFAARPTWTHPLFAEHDTCHLVSWHDDRGSVWESKSLPGATALVTAQAQCPFRAYALFRWKLHDPVAAHEFPDAIDRGNLLHEILHRIVAHAPDQTTLENLTAEILSSHIESVVRTALNRLPEQFCHAEVQRLLTIVQQWLQFECLREPFTARLLEARFDLEIADHTMHARIDRIDLVGNRLLIIDYKTGNAALPAIEADTTDNVRITDAQLPLYAQIDAQHRGLHEPVGGVCFFRLSEPMKLQGIAEDTLNVASGRGVKLQTVSDFTALQHQWSDALTGLVNAFINGGAAVQPLSSKVCERCHLQALCHRDRVLAPHLTPATTTEAEEDSDDERW